MSNTTIKYIDHNSAKSNIIGKNIKQKLGYCARSAPIFLAATSSSRSDVVTQSVCLFVRPSPFFSLVSLESEVHLECHKASENIKGI